MREPRVDMVFNSQEGQSRGPQQIKVIIHAGFFVQ